MEWMWLVGAGVVGMCSVACGLNLGARVARGLAKAWDRDVLAWAVGFHGVAGVAALMLVLQVKG